MTLACDSAITCAAYQRPLSLLPREAASFSRAPTLVEICRVVHRIEQEEAELAREWLAAVEEVLGNLLGKNRRRPQVRPAARLLMAVQALEDLQEIRPEPHVIDCAGRVADKKRRSPPALSGLEAMAVLVDSVSRAVASACRGGTPSRLRYSRGFHTTMQDTKRVTAPARLLQMLRREVRLRELGDLRAEANGELARLAPRRTSAVLLTNSELRWLTAFVKLAAEGPILECHSILSTRLGISESSSEKLARRVRAKGMLTPLGENGKPDWRPTRLALKTAEKEQPLPDA